MKKMTFIILAMAFVCCKNDPGEAVKAKEKQRSAASKETVVYGPAKAGNKKIGTVVFGKDSFEIWQRYTNEIAFTQESTDDTGKKQSYRYREMEVLAVIITSKDTIVMKRSDFKPYFKGSADEESLIMQSAVLDQPMKKGIVPLIIDLCVPDSDVCASFEITIVDGKAKFNELGDADFSED